MRNANASSRSRFFRTSCGSPFVPDRYGPATRMMSGLLADMDMRPPPSNLSDRAESCNTMTKCASSGETCHSSRVLTSQRKRFILDVLQRDGQVIAKNLSRELNLSEDTIRRDLRELASDGLLQRVHGGALPASP